jgi:hypothetical protein
MQIYLELKFTETWLVGFVFKEHENIIMAYKRLFCINTVENRACLSVFDDSVQCRIWKKSSSGLGSKI